MEKRLLQKAFDALQNIAAEKELKEGLREILSEILEDTVRLDAAVQMYRYYFDREIPFGRELAKDGENIQQGRISTAVFFARALWLDREKRYALPAGSGDFVAQFLRFLRENKEKYGHYAMIGDSRFLGYAYTFPYIFRLGRLEFEIATFAYPYRVYGERGRIWALAEQTITEENGIVTGRQYREDGLELGEKVTLFAPECLLTQGDPVLSVHIPGSEKMTEELVDASFAQVPGFFGRYFPKMQFKGYICSSWMLNKDLSRFLREESNILRFQKRFQVPFRQRYDGALFHYIFHLPKASPLEELVPQNRFQREILEYVKAGGILYSGRGFCLRK